MKKKCLSIHFLLMVLGGRSQADSVSLRHKHVYDSLDTFQQVPVFSMAGGDAEADLDDQDISSLLQSSKDLFTQVAGFQFGIARYRMRGYSAENQLVMINGVNVSNPETGYSSWSSWGGLNDVARLTETRFGNTANRYGFSGPGGYTNIDSRASSFKKGTRVSYTGASRIFRHRMMLTYSTGTMKRGWALSVSVSGRYGNEVLLPGTFFKAGSMYFSLDKKLKDKHLFSFVSFCSPIEKGLTASATLETYKISGSHYYNSAWGYQNGEKRNASVSRSNRPMILFSHSYTPDQKKRLTSSLNYTFGKSGISGLNFYNAPNPKPDYYKYLPGYFYERGDIAAGDAVGYKWEHDINTKQVNWDKLIALNRANLYSGNEQEVNTEEKRARYIVESREDNLNQVGCNFVYNERKENLFLSIGGNALIYKNRKYKEVTDLLGSTFWIDVDQFAQNLGVDPIIQQNDIERPDRKVYAGDRFGYDYFININRAELWGQLECTFRKLDVYGALSMSSQNMWRTGEIANGKFPLTSKGDSEKLNFLNFGFKAGATYKLSGRNFITANISVFSRAPETANVFISPRVRNDIVDGIKNEDLVSSDLSYLAKYPDLKIRFTLYATQINEQTWLRSYFDENYNTLINLIMTGVNQSHQGFELGLEKTVRTSHSLQFVSGLSRSRYSSNPELQAWQDNNNAFLYYNREAYLKNYRLGGSPQFVSALGYRYQGQKMWSVGFCLNYFDEIYIEPNPDRRTSEAVSKFQTDEKELASVITAQEKLPAYFVLNANAAKSFRIKKKHVLGFNVSINNLLNNRSVVVGGYEQLRWDPQQVSKFPTKYTYMSGITYMFILNFSF